MKSDFYTKEKAGVREQVFNKNPYQNFHFNNIFFNAINNLTPSNSRILDIGTGDGFVLFELHKLFQKSGFKLFGIDSSKYMLETAQKKNDIGATFLLGDNYHLPFKDKTFQTVTAKNVTNFSAEETYRIMAPDGIFIFREYGPGKGLVEIANIFQKKLIRSRTPSFYIERLTQAGFRDITLEEFQIFKEYSSRDLIQTLDSFPFIKNYSQEDKYKIISLVGSKSKIKITSDPIVITAKK